MTVYDQQVDASGLLCPLPLLKAKQALAGLGDGQVLRVISTDPSSVKDFKSYAKQTGHALEMVSEEQGKFYFLLRKVAKSR